MSVNVSLTEINIFHWTSQNVHHLFHSLNTKGVILGCPTVQPIQDQIAMYGPWTKTSLSAKAYHNRNDWILCSNLILDKLVPFTIEQRRLMEEECSEMCFCLKKVLVIVGYHWCTCGIYLACTLTDTKINETSLKPPHVKYFIKYFINALTITQNLAVRSPAKQSKTLSVYTWYYKNISVWKNMTQCGSSTHSLLWWAARGSHPGIIKVPNHVRGRTKVCLIVFVAIGYLSNPH